LVGFKGSEQKRMEDIMNKKQATSKAKKKPQTLDIARFCKRV
jgi:hypothetical protein